MGNAYISMLRGINVSGHNKLAMPELKRLYESLGLGDVRTYVQSGNVVFTCQPADPAGLAKTIEAGIRSMFGLEVPVLVRDAQDFQRVIAGNPFLSGRLVDPAQLYVTFLYQAVEMIKLGEAPSPNADGDEYSLGEREIYLYCPKAYGRTKLSNTYFERKLKVAATTRNWKTVNALYELAHG